MINRTNYIKKKEKEDKVISDLNIIEKGWWFCQKEICEFTKNEILSNLVITEENIHLLEDKRKTCTNCSKSWGWEHTETTKQAIEWKINGYNKKLYFMDDSFRTKY